MTAANSSGTTLLHATATCKRPKAPAGFEKNWVPTVAGKAWFPYFRLYAPTEEYFNRTWLLPDFVKVK